MSEFATSGLADTDLNSLVGHREFRAVPESMIVHTESGVRPAQLETRLDKQRPICRTLGLPRQDNINKASGAPIIQIFGNHPQSRLIQETLRFHISWRCSQALYRG